MQVQKLPVHAGDASDLAALVLQGRYLQALQHPAVQGLVCPSPSTSVQPNAALLQEWAQSVGQRADEKVKASFNSSVFASPVLMH